MPGNIFKILVKPGDVVSKGQNVLVLEAMKMENNITSDYAGKVKRILTQEGKSVTATFLLHITRQTFTIFTNTLILFKFILIILKIILHL